MSEFRVASRYAKALFTMAKEQNVLDAVKDDMATAADLFAGETALTSILKDPLTDAASKLSALNKVFAGKVQTLTTSFFELVARKRRANALGAIAKAFLALYNEEKGIVKASVTTTVPLTEKLRADFVAAAMRISKAQSIDLIEDVDPKLIGGFVFKIGDLQIDNAVSNKLNVLRRSLITR